MRKRIISTGISVLLFIFAFFATIRQETVDVYALGPVIFVGENKIEGTVTDPDNGWKCTLNEATGKATLIMEGAAIRAVGDSPTIRVYEADLTIILKGKPSKIISDIANGHVAIEQTDGGSITIKSDGTPGTLIMDGYIHTTGGITISNANVTLDGGGQPAISAGLQVDVQYGNNNIDVTQESNANITINNSRVTATGGTNGLLASGTVSVNGKDTSVVATAVGVDLAGEPVCPAIEAGRILIGDGLKIVNPEKNEVRSRGNGGNPQLYAVYDTSSNRFAKKVVINPDETEKVRFMEKDDDDDSNDEAVPVKTNTNNQDVLSGLFYVSGQSEPAPGVIFIKQAQGLLGIEAFAHGRPAGYTSAFTFNMYINGKSDYTLKKGKLVLDIPPQYQKAGRTFAITAIDKNGQVHVFYDTDNDPAKITVNIDIEAYAFELNYKD